MDFNLEEENSEAESKEVYDRAKALRDFDDTKAGVKGLVDAGIATLPEIFVMPPEDYSSSIMSDGHSGYPQFKAPTVDLQNMDETIVGEIREACESWGFFKVINHGIPQDVLDDMIEGVRKFNEQQQKLKMEFYSRDKMKKVQFLSNFDLYVSKSASWRDTLMCLMAPNPPKQHV